MFFNDRIIILINCFPSECRNSQVLTLSNLKMMLSFVIKGNIAATTPKFVNNARTRVRE